MQCWAFNREGVRCQQDMTAHAAFHSYTQEWDDDECYDPAALLSIGTPAPPMTDTSPAPTQPPTLPDPMPTPTGCIACGHKHKGGECKCGCYEFVG